MDVSFALGSVEDKPVDCMCKSTCAYVDVLSFFIGEHSVIINPASCLSKRVDDQSRVYANLTDARGAGLSRLSVYVVKPKADVLLFNTFLLGT